MRTRAQWLALALLATACGSAAASDGFDNGAPANNGGSQGPSTSGGSFGDDAGAEQEVESNYQSPVATGNYVWITNPVSGRVAYINASTLEVNTAEAGNGPTYLAAVPVANADEAIVLNVLSNDATLLIANGANVTAKNFPTATGLNAWSLSSDGRWAIAWTDVTKLASPPPSTQGFQDITIIDLSGKDAPTTLAVGYRPVTVGFAASNTSAYAVTQDGISILDLTGATPVETKNVAISDTPLDDTTVHDVSVTPDGAIAFLRRDGDATITAVSLATGVRTDIVMPGDPTDLDLDPAGDKAVAVIRALDEVVVMPVPAILSAPTVFTTVTVTDPVGSVSIAPNGSTGLLYTNATPLDLLGVLSLDASLAYHEVRLYAPVLAVFGSPDASNAVVIHNQVQGSPGAYSLVPVAAGLPAVIQQTNAPPTAVAFSPTSDRAVIAERDDTTKSYALSLATFPSLMVSRYTLASPPSAVGIVAGAQRAYAVQDHPEGRITFVDLGSGQARTLTGFELAARVVDGSNP